MDMKKLKKKITGKMANAKIWSLINWSPKTNLLPLFVKWRNVATLSPRHWNILRPTSHLMQTTPNKNCAMRPRITGRHFIACRSVEKIYPHKRNTTGAVRDVSFSGVSFVSKYKKIAKPAKTRSTRISCIILKEEEWQIPYWILIVMLVWPGG